MPMSSTMNYILVKNIKRIPTGSMLWIKDWKSVSGATRAFKPFGSSSFQNHIFFALFFWSFSFPFLSFAYLYDITLLLRPIWPYNGLYDIHDYICPPLSIFINNMKQSWYEPTPLFSKIQKNNLIVQIPRIADFLFSCSDCPRSNISPSRTDIVNLLPKWQFL